MDRNQYRKLLGLSLPEWADLVRAQGALVRAQLLVRTRPLGQLLVPAKPAPRPTTNGTPPTPTVQRLALAVQRVAAYGLFRPTCLVQAIALQNMIRARGFEGSAVRVGVRWKEGRFQAHAWVDFGGAVLADHPIPVNRFDTLDVGQPS
jgi:hypothetical protein